MNSHLIAPSVLASNFLALETEIKMINESQADWIHLDIMDGRFVPNISFGLPVVQAISKVAKKLLDVHLMIVEPEKYLSAFHQAGAGAISVHIEACPHLHRTIQEIKQLGCKAGVAINPHTDVRLLFDILEDIDFVCMMSVNPGFGGQKFIYRTLEKIKVLKSEIISRNCNVLIEVDGGVGLQNIEVLLSTGADILVAGNSVFSSKDPMAEIAKMKQVSVNTFV
ncbi:MAG TPA: ribulose-phosphate 3-epimerase [Saprospiraceae bacterium]|nr:ribulose-phosphate 3-epimerase [Saprospiraceae bacterium]